MRSRSAITLLAMWVSIAPGLPACASTPAPAVGKSQPTPRSMRVLPPPRLLLVVVIDQLGSETLHKLEPLLHPDGALRTMLARGRVWSQLRYPYASTFTAPGHVLLHSGAVPSESGISANYVVSREPAASGRPDAGPRLRAAVDDGLHEVLGHEGAFASPKALRVQTVADALKEQSGGSAKVVSLSLKDRGAILPAGKQPDLVLWLDDEARGFTTSTFYARHPPQWLATYQREHPIEQAFELWQAGKPGELSAALGPDDGPGEGSYRGLGTTFPHDIAAAEDSYAAWRLSPASSEYLLELAFRAAQELKLGEDEQPDLLAISISGTDYAGHVFGPDSWEYADHLRRADLALMKLIRRLQARTQLAVVVTSDHGSAPLPERVLDAAQAGAEGGHVDEREPEREAKARAMRVALGKLVAIANDEIAARFGAGEWVAGAAMPFLYLSQAALTHPQAAEIRDLAVEIIKAQPTVAQAFDVARLSQVQAPASPLERAAKLSVHPDTSGEILVVLAEHHVAETGMAPEHGTNHGSTHSYDSIVPLLITAPGVTPLRIDEPDDARRVAPTLAELLGIEPPPAASSTPLPGVVPTS